MWTLKSGPGRNWGDRPTGPTPPGYGPGLQVSPVHSCSSLIQYILELLGISFCPTFLLKQFLPSQYSNQSIHIDALRSSTGWLKKSKLLYCDRYFNSPCVKHFIILRTVQDWKVGNTNYISVAKYSILYNCEVMFRNGLIE